MVLALLGGAPQEPTVRCVCTWDPDQADDPDLAYWVLDGLWFVSLLPGVGEMPRGGLPLFDTHPYIA